MLVPSAPRRARTSQLPPGFWPVMVGSIALVSLLATAGCRRKPSPQETAQASQAESVADRRAALEYLKKDGQIDWRKRVDAASKAIDEAKSNRRWGRSEQALEQALEAAKLLPPASKDFDSAASPRQPRAGAGDAEGANRGSGQPQGGSQTGGDGEESGQTPERAGVTSDPEGDLEGNSEPSRSGGDSVDSGLPVSNAEVEELRQSLHALLESLESSTGNSRRNLNFDRDAIEIR